jgi:hypothetical protein
VRRRWGLLLLSALFLVFVVGARCGGDDNPAPVGSGIEGSVTIGPLCPVVREDTPCPDGPFQAEIVITNASGNKVARAASDEEGRFRVDLPPGTYTLVPQSPNAGAPPQAPEQQVEVAEGAYTQVTVQYDSGIR